MRPGFKPPPVHLNVISGRGGLGDQVARLPAYKSILERFNHVSMTIWAQDYFIDLAKYLLPPSDRLEWHPLSDAPYTMPWPRIEFNMERLTTLNLHLTQHAFLILTDGLAPDQASLNYPRVPQVLSHPLKMISPLDIESKLVVFTVANTAPSRAWPAFQINRLAKLVKARGLQPVLLGTDQPISTGVPNDDIKARMPDGLDRSLFVDLVGQTTLIEALGIIQRAKAVVGVDNGLLHLAHCTDVPVVMGFTTLKPEHRVPYRAWPLELGIEGLVMNGRLGTIHHGLTAVLEAQVPCGGCQSKGTFINHDWRTCLFDDYACTLTLTADRFMEKLIDLGVFD